MTASVTHSFVSAKADGADNSLVQPSDWNAAHVISGVVNSSDHLVYVNDLGAVGDGSSHPLSERYATLAEAQAVYPHATALTDEIDWCAWQAATNAIYALDDGSYSNYNMSAGTIIADGQYVINRTITFNHAAIRIIGAGPSGGFKYAGATSITYNGADGTVDAPVPIFDFYVFDENGAAPPGRNSNPASGGIRVHVEHISFNGKVTSAGAYPLGFAKYISAIRLRQAVFAQIRNCNFGQWLYDGIYCTGPQLFLIIERNVFYGIERDAIAVWAFRGNFSTTTWIYNNEFGFVTRYCILLDLSGSVEAFPIVRDNSFEATQTLSSYYITRPEWWVQGVPATSCIINGGNLVWSGNRDEGGVANINQYLWGQLHLMSGTFQTVENCTGSGNLVLSGERNTVNRTSQAVAMWGNAPTWAATTAYATTLSGNCYIVPTVANGYYYQCTTGGTSGGSQPTWPTTIGATVADGTVVWTCKGAVQKFHDITDARNYNACTSGDNNGSTLVQHLTLRKVYSNASVFLLDGLLGTSSTHNFEDLSAGVRIGNIPTTAGTYAQLAEARITSKPALMSIPNTVNMRNVSVTELTGSRLYAQYFRGTGNYLLQNGVSQWAANTAYVATWFSSPTLVRSKASEDGRLYRCTVSGTSSGTEPTWPSVVGNTVVDGTVTWTCIGTVPLVADANVLEWSQNGKVHRNGTAAPTTGTWAVGSTVWNTAPAAAGFMGWVCTTAGTPGTWKTFGAITA